MTDVPWGQSNTFVTRKENLSHVSFNQNNKLYIDLFQIAIEEQPINNGRKSLSLDEIHGHNRKKRSARLIQSVGPTVIVIDRRDS